MYIENIAFWDKEFLESEELTPRITVIYWYLTIISLSMVIFMTYENWFECAINPFKAVMFTGQHIGFKVLYFF